MKPTPIKGASVTPQEEKYERVQVVNAANYTPKMAIINPRVGPLRTPRLQDATSAVMPRWRRPSAQFGNAQRALVRRLRACVASIVAMASHSMPPPAPQPRYYILRHSCTRAPVSPLCCLCSGSLCGEQGGGSGESSVWALRMTTQCVG